MNAIFSSNRFSGLKRRPRANKSDTSPSKAKPLDILPDVSEEDEDNYPSSSLPTTKPTFDRGRMAGVSATLGSRYSQVAVDHRRESRRVVLTGAEGLSFDDFFPGDRHPTLTPRTPSPSPSPQTSTFGESPLDDINLRFSGLGISVDFPSPPRSSISTVTQSYRRNHSPTPSVSSNYTTSTATSHASPQTPSTSDDECHPRLARAPTIKSQRGSVYYATAHYSAEPSCELPPTPVEEAEELDEDASWFAQDISDFITLTSPLPPSFPLSTISEAKARPDSVLSSVCRRDSMVLVPSSGTINHLDPSIPKRRTFIVPTRPPPPPPIFVDSEPLSPTMEDATEELLAQLANAALNSGFVGTGLSVPNPARWTSAPPTPNSVFVLPSPARPPPRMSIPADVNDPIAADGKFVADDESGIFEFRMELDTDQGLASPMSISLYSQSSMDSDSDVCLPQSPISPPASPPAPKRVTDNHASMAPANPDSPMSELFVFKSDTSSIASTDEPERRLRSRWSTSTLGSIAERQSHSASWMTRLHLGSPLKKGKEKERTKSKPAMKSPVSPAAQRSFEFERGLTRRDSSSSRMSDVGSDSGESTASSGLRRKPIPVEIFMRG